MSKRNLASFGLVLFLFAGCRAGHFITFTQTSGDQLSLFSPGASRPNAPASQATTLYQTATIRRLSNVEISNSIQDIFMEGTPLTGDLLPLQRVRGGFDNQIAALDVTTPFMSVVQQLAEQASAYLVQNVPTVVACDTSTASCISSYVGKVGRRAFRRPLSADELNEYLALYNSRLATDGSALALSAVVEALIQSPFFLYRTEFGVKTADSNSVTLTPYETAAALSYFILSSAPDDQLLDAAAANQLANPDQRAAQIRRLMKLPGAHKGEWNFFLQWAQVRDPQILTGSFGAAYPEFTVEAANSAVTETQTFFDQEVFSGAADWKNFFASKSGTLKSGFLTQASFIASHSDGGGFSPVHFGLFVATQLFCNTIPPPPANVPALHPDPTGSTSARSRFASHLSTPYCAACHSKFDPMGWGFEQYNPIGQYQTAFANTVLTGAGSLVGTDVNGDFTGVPQLASMITQSRQAQACFTSKVYEFALGRTHLDDNLVSTVFDRSASISAAQFATDTNIQNLLVSVGQSEAFVMRDATSMPLAGKTK